MPQLNVFDLNNKQVGSVDVADAVFAAEVSEALLFQSVRHYLACRRAGTHKTKGRGEVSGSGKKLWKQKGTGRARIGSVRSPVWRKGAIKVVQEFTISGHRTSEFAQVLKKLEAGRKVLLVDNSDNRNLELSSRNLPGVMLVDSQDVHPYDLLNAETIIFSKATVEKCSEALS